jgi:hypothetical protein
MFVDATADGGSSDSDARVDSRVVDATAAATITAWVRETARSDWASLGARAWVTGTRTCQTSASRTRRRVTAREPASGSDYFLRAKIDTLFTPNFVVAPSAPSEMKRYSGLSCRVSTTSPAASMAVR